MRYEGKGRVQKLLYEIYIWALFYSLETSVDKSNFLVSYYVWNVKNHQDYFYFSNILSSLNGSELIKFITLFPSLQ